MSAEKRATTHGHTPSRDRDRLAHLALAADRPALPGDCPDDETFARFVEQGPNGAGEQSVFEHISTCEACYQKWLSVSDVVDTGRAKDRGAGRRKRLLMTAAGSVCATAVGIMLYLSIDYQPMVQVDSANSVYSEKAPGPPAVAQKAAPQGTGAALEPEQDELKAVSSYRKRTLDPEESEAVSGGEVAADMVMEAQRVPEERFTAALSKPSASSPQLVEEEGGPAHFIEQFVALCGDYRENRVKQSTVEALIEQGQELLRADEVTGEERAVIVEINGILEKGDELDADAFTDICKRAVEFGSRKGYDVRGEQPELSTGKGG